jgi:hypothetical protein
MKERAWSRIKTLDRSLGYVLTMGLNYAFELLHPVAKQVMHFRG